MSVTLEAGGWLGKLVYGAASATVIGGGSLLLNLHRNDAVQDQNIAHIEQTLTKMDTLSEKLDTTTSKVDVLNARLEQKERDDGRTRE